MSEVLPTPEPVLSLSKSKKAKSKVEILKAYAAQFHAYLQAAGGPAAWEAHVRESLAEAPEFGECYLPEAEEAVFTEIGPAPQGWKNWNWAVHTLDDQPVMQVKRVVTVKEDDLSNSDLAAAPKTPKAPKVPKPKKEAIARDMRSVFNRLMAEVTPESLYRPWMAQHTLRLIETPEALKTWINRVQGDFSSWHLTPTGEKMPVVAVDTETFGTISTTGLDTRLVRGRPQIDIAGICLCADGLDSIYIPLNHEEGPNLDRKLVREMLQPLFDTSYLVYFNAKFDREVLRLTMGISFRDYPYFEDVQVDNYLLDPKADLDEEVSDYGGAGLKDLALRDLGIDQIELGELSKVKALYVNPQNNKKSYRNFYAPFSWLPPRIAYLYAAADSLTTWLLWKKKSEAASRMKFPFKLDHMLIDSLTWIERQRFLIDTVRHAETVALHHRKMAQFRAKLEELSGVPGFNPGSTAQLADVLFNKLGFPKGKVSEKTQAASTDKTVLEDLKKAFPGHPFLIALSRYRSYASLHPSSLEYDKRDLSARMFFKQCTVAGGRLAAMGGGIKGGKGKDDGGFGLNPQAIKGVKGNKWAKGRAIIFPEGTADLFEPEWLEPIADDLLDASILKKTDDKITVEAPDVVNGVAHYMGRWWSFRPEPVLTATPSAAAREAYGFGDALTLRVDTLTQSVDVNEVVNLRGLFIAPPGYTLFVTDYSNIEMRVAANVSRETRFIDEFLTGSGDFHTLTAKAVFPEFSTTKDKVVRKMLRDLAKIINFALLYGGTEHTIYENMKKQDPTITKEKAKAMVDKYWDSVPMFAMWAHSMRKAARETLICKTPDGRVIDFRSALAAEGLTEPAKESYKATRHYWDVRNRAKALEAAGRKEEAKTVFAQAQAIWDDPDSGVANAAGYKKMVGKFERVSVNAPLQGLAGDLMRRALVLIHRWAERSGVEGALLVHASVHDEIDFCIKNEYVPYILPRITRIMKLRDLHAVCKWPVPIECDCEYGTSWDVKFHLTGDDGHTASGYTNVPGLETYIPGILDPGVEESLFAAMDGGPDTRNEAIAYLKEVLCDRVHDVLDRIQPKPDPDPKRTPPTPDVTEARRLLVAALQLHEYWAIDQNEDPATDEPLASYMERFGLEPFPGLGEHVLSTVKVEELPPLEATAEPAPDVATDETEEVENDVAAEVVPEALPVATPAPVDVTPEPLTVTPPPPAPPGKKKVPLRQDGRLVIRDLTEDELKDFKRAIGVGGYTLKVIFKGETFDVHKCGGTPVPEHFLVMVDADE